MWLINPNSNVLIWEFMPFEIDQLIQETAWDTNTVATAGPNQGPYAPQGSRKLPKWSRCSKSVLPTLILTSEVRYSRSIGEVNSNRVTSSLLRKWTRLPTHACEVRALTFEVTDNFGSNDALPCGAYGPSWKKKKRYHSGTKRRDRKSIQQGTSPVVHHQKQSSRTGPSTGKS